ncbi:MAG: hypothetical protein HYS32_04065 [Candidatus Woesearchaeota archaeon]|nr:MAG: hypothetical protein HYS32_04065 [Candidatus Woesearchaeota archaeon]
MKQFRDIIFLGALEITLLAGTFGSLAASVKNVIEYKSARENVDALNYQERVNNLSKEGRRELNKRINFAEEHARRDGDWLVYYAAISGALFSGFLASRRLRR